MRDVGVGPYSYHGVHEHITTMVTTLEAPSIEWFHASPIRLSRKNRIKRIQMNNPMAYCYRGTATALLLERNRGILF